MLSHEKIHPLKNRSIDQWNQGGGYNQYFQYSQQRTKSFNHLNRFYY
jgi:hypothetical protein